MRLLAAMIGASVAIAASAAEPARLLPGSAYPITVVLSEPAARFHWLDSLAGFDLPGGSAGKTVGAHRAQFVNVLGPPTDADREHLRRFADVRVRYAERRYEEWKERGDADFSGLLEAFLGATDEATALRRAARHLGADDLATLTAALAHFRPRYAAIWRDGRWAEPFLRDAARRGDGRRLASMLARQARFFGVDLPLDPEPRVVLVPVAPGAGTHASALGQILLVELRPDDRLREAASVLAHENAHFLFDAVPAERLAELERVFRSRGDGGAAAWQTLEEALPTALGQGVFDRTFRRDAWSTRHPWYHREDVDRYAKEIYPAVDRAFRKGRGLDAALAAELAEAWTRPTAADAPEVTPRSP